MANQPRAFQDGSLGHVFRDGSLGILGGHVFQDGSLGAAMPRPGSQHVSLNNRMRMLRKFLATQGLGIAARPMAKDQRLRQAVRGLGARMPTPGEGRRWNFIHKLKRRFGLKGLGQEEDVSVKFSVSPTVKAIGLVTVAGLGAYGIYRLTSKKK